MAMGIDLASRGMISNLNKKIDELVISGGGSDNNFTDALKNKLENIEPYAEVNTVTPIDLENKLEIDNIIQGENILLTKDGNNITINSIGGTSGSTIIVDNLTSESTISALSANQGRILNTTKLSPSNIIAGSNITLSTIGNNVTINSVGTGGTITPIVDNLTSTSTSSALSANQGRILNTTKEPIIASSTSTNYWNGLKQFVDLATSVRTVVLTGMSVATNTVVLVTDTILVAIGKLQSQITSLTNNVLTKTNTTSFTPTLNYHPATKKYVDDTIGTLSSTLESRLDGVI